MLSLKFSSFNAHNFQITAYMLLSLLKVEIRSPFYFYLYLTLLPLIGREAISKLNRLISLYKVLF